MNSTQRSSEDFSNYSPSVEDEDKDDEFELEELDDDASSSPILYHAERPRWFIDPSLRHSSKPGAPRSHPPFWTPSSWRRRSWLYIFARTLQTAAIILVSLILVTAVFFPSYSHPPQHYQKLRWRVEKEQGTANINNEKVFIAASLSDTNGHLVAGAWGQSVLRLIEILGSENVFLSIYEDNADNLAISALEDFRKQLECDAEIVTENLDLDRLPHVALPDGTQRLKRISFLASVRNRALRPLDDPRSPAFTQRFDKLLYVNDVVFDPVDAANLLFSTNVDAENGKTQYRAACAVDFINPFKFYDTFATRDMDSYDMGLPFYPFFSSAGSAASRHDVLAQTDAVRVRSCWGGMVAFEAKWFQTGAPARAPVFNYNPTSNATTHQGTRAATIADNMAGEHDLISESHIDRIITDPLRFRAEESAFWEASECCLIHADLSARDSGSLADGDTGVYMNPYVRVAYSSSVLPWLAFTRRFERLYSPFQFLLNILAHRPSSNPRQFEIAGDEIRERDWVWDEESRRALALGATSPNFTLHGGYANVTRVASPGGFCGTRRLLYIKKDALPGERNWAEEILPSTS